MRRVKLETLDGEIRSATLVTHPEFTDCYVVLSGLYTGWSSKKKVDEGDYFNISYLGEFLQVRVLHAKPLTWDHWDAVDPKWKYLAMDKDLSWHFCTCKPSADKQSWLWSNRDAKTLGVEWTHFPSILTPPRRERPWTETLIERT